MDSNHSPKDLIYSQAAISKWLLPSNVIELHILGINLLYLVSLS